MKDYELALRASRKDKSDKNPKRKQQMVELCRKWSNRNPFSANYFFQEFNMCSLSNVDVNNDDTYYENDLVDEQNILDATNANSDGDLMVVL